MFEPKTGLLVGTGYIKYLIGDKGIEEEVDINGNYSKTSWEQLWKEVYQNYNIGDITYSDRIFGFINEFWPSTD